MLCAAAYGCPKMGSLPGIRIFMNRCHAMPCCQHAPDLLVEHLQQPHALPHHGQHHRHPEVVQLVIRQHQQQHPLLQLVQHQPVHRHLEQESRRQQQQQ